MDDSGNLIDPTASPEAGSDLHGFNIQSLELAIAELEQQVAEAQAELEQYQGLLNELPGIYEDKFRQKLRTVAQDVRHLLDERNALQAQVSRALPPAQEAEVAQPAEARSEVGSLRFRTPSTVVESVQGPRISWPSLPFPLPSGRLWVLSLAGGFGTALLLIFGLQFLANRRTASRVGTVAPIERSRIPSSAAATLSLEARGGQSWVLVERLGGGIVYDAILEPGQSKDLPLGSGLKIRSGRPDLLYVGMGTPPSERLGGVDDVDWFEFRP